MAHISSESRNPLRYCVFKICVSHARFVVSQILCLCGLLSVMCSSSLLAQLAPNSVPLDSALILQPFWMLLLPSLSLENLPILPGGEPASLFQPAPWNRFSRILKSFLRWLVLRIRRAEHPSFWGHDWYIGLLSQLQVCWWGCKGGIQPEGCKLGWPWLKSLCSLSHSFMDPCLV